MIAAAAVAMIFSPLALIASPAPPSLSLSPLPVSLSLSSAAAARDHRQILTKEMMIDVRDEICSGEKNDGGVGRIGAAFAFYLPISPHCGWLLAF